MYIGQGAARVSYWIFRVVAMLDDTKISIKSELKVLTNGIHYSVYSAVAESAEKVGVFKSGDVAITLKACNLPGVCIGQRVAVNSGRTFSVASVSNELFRVVEDTADKLSLVVYGLCKRAFVLVHRAVAVCRFWLNRACNPLSHSARLAYGGCLRL